MADGYTACFAPEDLILAMDIGGSKFICGLVTPEGKILFSERFEWQWDRPDTRLTGMGGASDDQQSQATPERFMEQLQAGIEWVRAKDAAAFERVVVGGVTVPGFCDPIDGAIIETDFLKINNYPLCEQLSALYDIPFYADNDCKAAALAEQVFGAAKSEELFYVTISTGVGGTHVLHDGVLYGAFGHAGEIGLVIADRAGFASDQGLPGVLEAHACGRGIIKNYLLAGGSETLDGKSVDGKLLAEAARAGNACAQEALNIEGRLLARALAPICEALPVERVVIGGGMSLQFDTFAPALTEELARLGVSDVQLSPTNLGYLGAFLGAAALGMRGHAGELPAPSVPAAHYFEVSLNNDALELTVIAHNTPRLHANACPAQLGNFLLAENVEDSGCLLIDKLQELLESYAQACGAAQTLEARFELLAQTARSQDHAAQQTLDELGYSIGRALAADATVLDPGSIVFRGVLGAAWDILAPSVTQALIDETYYRGKLPFSLVARP